MLQSSIESPKDMIILSIDNNYNYLYFNECHKATMSNVYGKDVSIGMNLLDCITSVDDKINAKTNYDKALSGESHITVQEFGELDKSYYETRYNPIFNYNNEIIGATAFSANITERKKAEAMVRDKDIQFRKLSSHVPDLIFQFTRRLDGSYFVPIASEGIKNIFGCSPEDVLDDFTPIGNVIYPEDSERVIKDIEYSAKHLTFFTCEFRVQIPGREIQWIYSRSTPEKLSDGRVTWYGFNANITERKQAELLLKLKNDEIEAQNEEYRQLNDELQKAKEKAEESDHLKTAFLENISHEVRTPMNAILGFSQLLLNPETEEEKKRQYTDILHVSTNKLLSIVDNTVTLAHIETKQIKLNSMSFCPNELLSKLLNEYNSKKQIVEKSHIEFVLNKTDKIDFKITNDYTRLNQIFNILLDNALKFTESGTIEFGCNFKENRIVFYVKDTGIGIPENKQHIIFKSFTQADKNIRQSFGGLGVGLSIALGLIKLLDGVLKINSQENIGTEIKFSLPFKISNN